MRQSNVERRTSNAGPLRRGKGVLEAGTFNERFNAATLAETAANFSGSASNACSSTYPSSNARYRSEATSIAEPYACSRKCAKSLSEFRPEPSAILDEIEVEARRTCDVIPQVSSLGNCLVIL